MPAKLNRLTLDELRERFGAVSAETQTVRGEWTHEGIVYRDELARVFIDAPDTPATRKFFRQYKQVLKDRYRQVEIWMTTYPIGVV